MSQASVISGFLAGHRTSISGPAQPCCRKGAAETLDDIRAAERIERRDQMLFGRRVGEVAEIDADRAGERQAERRDTRPGAPSSAFLAQHIAQEVAPEDPGLGSYRAGSHAYLMRRESTIEFMAAHERVDFYA